MAEIKRIAIACQGGGSHAAYTAGVLKALFQAQCCQPVRIMGLSGTSGGAMCALLAWYGMLKRWPDAQREADEASKLLDAFWNDNTTGSTWEEIWNSWAVLVSRLPVEVRLSPYDPPLSWAERQLERWAPRREFVDLRKLLSKHIRFDDIATIGRFNQLRDEIKQWRLARTLQDLQAADPAALDSARILERFAAVKQDIQRLKAGEFDGMKQLVAGVPEEGSDEDRLDALESAIQQVPLLLIGAVDVLAGEFKAFSSAHNEISLDAALASATLPWIFKAAKINGEGAYWDGLFSQNPPIKNFLAEPDSAREKPDEIWVVQINPQECAEEPRTADKIEDRRNELAGNLSLNQEITAITTINKWLAEGRLAAVEHKIVTIHRVRMDTARLEQDWLLDPASKLNRDPAFLNALISHGAVQARLFMPVRAFIELIWNEPQQAARRAAAALYCAGEGANTALAQIDNFYREYPNDFRVNVEKMDLAQSAAERQEPLRGQVHITWTARGTQLHGGKRVTLAGQAQFCIAADRIEDGAITDVRVVKISG